MAVSEHDDRLDGLEWVEDFECTWCGGRGVCTDGADPLDTCPDEAHRCHACGGSGKRSDQTLF